MTIDAMKKISKNTILYGPPGTGKTYNTVIKAMEIVYPEKIKRHTNGTVVNYDEILRAFNDEIKKNDGRIRFVTFHQSFSYEEFVEGIKPEIKNWDDEGQEVKYVGRDGIFKEICKQAQRIVVSSDKKVEDIDFSKVNIFKMSLYSDREDVYGYCLENNVIALGWGGDKDYSKCKNLKDIKKLKGSNEGASELNCFVNKMEKGDIVIISRGNSNFKAIARIKGNYFYNPDSEIEFSQFREVEWLYYGDNIPTSKIYYKNFSRSSCYKLRKNEIKTDVLNQIVTGGKEVQETKEIQEIPFDNLINKFKEKYQEERILKTCKGAKFEIIEYADDGFRIKPTEGEGSYSITFKNCETVYREKPKKTIDLEKLTTIKSYTSYYFAVYQELKKIEEELKEKRHYGDDYVLVIDEINRGNISKIFGELITLIEEDKREKLSVVLPYSKETFTVPENLYIIGTMNTSDRSIASIDIALRRRFQFEGMYPNSDLVVDKIDGLEFRKVFMELNRRIEIILDADHQIGHSYFMIDKIKTIEDLKDVWFRNILPLLNEYFYGDWEKLCLVVPKFVEKIEIDKDFEDYLDCPYRFRSKDEFIDNDEFVKALESLIKKSNTAKEKTEE